MASGIVQVEGKDAGYMVTPTAHEKYANRPPALENICLAQFFANYTGSSSKKRYTFDSQGAAGYSDSRVVFSWNPNEETHLPLVIKLQNKMGIMQLRKDPYVIRCHKYHQERDPHRFIYTELLFFYALEVRE